MHYKIIYCNSKQLHKNGTFWTVFSNLEIIGHTKTITEYCWNGTLIIFVDRSKFIWTFTHRYTMIKVDGQDSEL